MLCHILITLLHKACVGQQLVYFTGMYCDVHWSTDTQLVGGFLSLNAQILNICGSQSTGGVVHLNLRCYTACFNLFCCCIFTIRRKNWNLTD